MNYIATATHGRKNTKIPWIEYKLLWPLPRIAESLRKDLLRCFDETIQAGAEKVIAQISG